MTIVVLPATPERWPGLERVMQTPGDPELCWCQVFRVPREDWDARPVERNRADLERLVEAGQRPGLVAYDGDDAVGWCSVAPLAQLTRLKASPHIAAARPEGDVLDGRWAVTCFVVREEARGRGLLETLLTAAVDFAREHGATALEGYPLDVDAAEHVTPDELYGGTVTLFEQAGFRRLGTLGTERALMLLPL
jgi:GNAT superfamily N-acetyltransferase